MNRHDDDRPVATRGEWAAVAMLIMGVCLIGAAVYQILKHTR